MKKLIAALGLIATLAAAAPAMAQSVVPVYTTGSVAGYAQPFCPQLSFNLYRGLSDYYTQGQVTALQQYLSTLGYYQPVTGYFGQITYANVVRYQQTYRIYPVTGGVGPITRGVIAQNCGQAQGGGPTSGAFSLGVPFTAAQGQTVSQYGGQLDLTLNAVTASPYTVAIYPGYSPATSATVTLGQRCQAGTYCFYYPQQQFTLTQGQTISWMNYSVTLVSLSVNSATFVVTQSGTGPGPIGGITVTSPTSGQTYNRGQDMTISWGYPVTPNSTQIMLELYSASGSRIGLIAVSQNTSGSYTWHIPGFPQNYMCTMQYPNGLCGTAIPDGQYYIKVSASNNPFDANPAIIASATSGVFTMTGAGTGGQYTVSANPASGTVPLTTTFNVGGYTGSYFVNYGDGTSASLVSGQTSHTYYNRGTYTATFSSDYACLHSTPACQIAQQSLGSATVTVY